MNAIGGAATFGTAMGLAGSHDNQSQQLNTFDQTQQTTLSPMTGAERDLSEITTNLGADQTTRLRELMEQGFALSPDEMAQLDLMFNPQFENLRRFGNLMGQDLAGTRGLNTSDTPVAEAVLRETMPAAANLLSNKMALGLQTGMGMRNLNLQAALRMPGASQFNLSKLFNERLATGRTRSSGTTQGTFTPGFLDRLATVGGAQANITQAGATLGGGSTSAGGSNFLTQAGQFGQFFSDVRLKQDIRPVAWKWAHQPDNEYLGVIAQELAVSHPHLVHRDESGYLMVDYGALVALLLTEREALYTQLEHRDA